jgi:3-oxoacyl-(acyl-carrier-protein) synthase
MECIYINGIGNISPQNTFDQSMGEELARPEATFFVCQEPQYKQFIQKKLLRRMSRAVRMGLAAAHKALEEANEPRIDAIITGTAWGCVKDTEKFLETIIANDEQYLTPTAFVQSTHNTVAGQIALMHHNNCYNMSYVQGAVSFESALIDASLLFMDGKTQNVLVAGIDEQTDKLKVLLKRLTCAQENQPMGEGAACFILSNQKGEHTYAKIAAVNMLYRPKDSATIKNRILQAIKNTGLNPKDIDIILSGNIDASLESDLLPNAQLVHYKKLCGEYPTSTAFAMAVGAKAIQGDVNTKIALGLNNTPNNLLIYNQDQNINHSIIVLSKV